MLPPDFQENLDFWESFETLVTIQSGSILLYWPVDDSTHVDLEIAVVSYQHLLYLDEIHSIVIHMDVSHTALEHVEGVSALLVILTVRATCIRPNDSHKSTPIYK